MSISFEGSVCCQYGTAVNDENNCSIHEEQTMDELTKEEIHLIRSKVKSVKSFIITDHEIDNELIEQSP